MFKLEDISKDKLQSQMIMKEMKNENEEEIKKKEEKTTKKGKFFGDISEIMLPKDQFAKNKGFAIVEFTSSQSVDQIFSSINGNDKSDKMIEMTFNGRLIQILPSTKNNFNEIEKQQWEQWKSLWLNKENANTTTFPSSNYSKLPLIDVDELDDETLSKLPYKLIRDLRKKYNSVYNDLSWNTKQLNIQKSDLFNDSLSSLSSKLNKIHPSVMASLAETAIIQQTKDFLQEHGVCIDAFQGNRKTCLRSRNVILVKNIPFDIQIQDLQQLFSKYGQLGNILLPETKAMAIIQSLIPLMLKKLFRI
ncbi:RNA-binding protein Mrd1 (predicted) [Reticulomyxa filosa]|uniref:RNA-binding protein Mrd1 (Predicted) n=1 Tax=Reticulomyxa filosa TaxID=46433 RepID=X6LRS1_RETFI|nr:RNA-binding protein Mrd1 (predicted) [Reticulomyxa filosa]|eukprot:ETO04324.1 RNA-binding protein Mrd1 (predicted) [Reticulomyxa filosa]